MPLRPLATRLAPALLLLCLSSSALAAPSEADKRKAASLMVQGDRAAAAQRFPEALESYRAADRIMGVPSTRVAVARTLARTGKLLEARDVAQEVLDLPEATNEPRAFVNARAEAVRLVKELDERLPTLLISVSAPAGSEPEVKLDGDVVHSAEVGVARQLDPGSYVVSAAIDGDVPVKREITLQEGARERVELSLGAPDSSSELATAGSLDGGDVGTSKNGLRLGAYVSLGVGLVATGVGVLYAVKVGGTRDDSDAAFERCGSPCRDTNPEAAKVRDLDDQAESEQLISTAGFIVGGVGVATGVVLWLLSSGDDTPEGAERSVSSPGIQPWLGLGSAGVFGRF
ncbi:MAG: hypothetical protein R3B89_06610 [Polyangiaceae bacterium]